MKRTNDIALDVYSTFCEGGYMDDAGREKAAWHEPTAIPELTKAVESVPCPRKLVIEEDPLAHSQEQSSNLQIVFSSRGLSS